ncbi:hypothetical protein TWF703_008054 [Orbilia oligospora]|uniref:DASH complex subunit DAD4 n=1 Tax=Orbilia oligospora TaxID=2813651 RepID=A0A7C8JNR6_ORBOL|nr:hypothetical protein TWF703_008054 [Orbilia oligospora]
MESPHESQQSLLLNRIIGNVEKLNEAVKEFNNRIRVMNTRAYTIYSLQYSKYLPKTGY